MDNTNIPDMAKAASEATEQKWLTDAPRLYVQGVPYVEAWWAKEVFTRLSMILFILRNFTPRDESDGFDTYRTGLINIGLRGDPAPNKQDSTPSAHDQSPA